MNQQTHKRWLKVQSRLIRELEKKFAGAHVVILAQRTILNGEVCFFTMFAAVLSRL